MVPNVNKCTLFTVHTVADDTEGGQGEIIEGDQYSYQDGRPALIVSSTSWYISSISLKLISFLINIKLEVDAPISVCDPLCTPKIKGIVDTKHMLHGPKKIIFRWRYSMTSAPT